VSADALAAQLKEELAERWRQGDRPLAEELLTQHPQLWSQPEAALELIYEEICQRRAHEQPSESADFQRRFPQWGEQVKELFDKPPAATPPPARRGLPQVGEMLDEFQLVAELGRGAQGCVYLATQPDLADRAVVLKVTPCDGREHLSLARLQHTYIVPLYFVRDDPDRNLRILCMPYFGGTTLAALLQTLQDIPPAERTGQHLLDALNRAQASAPLSVPARGPARQLLARASYVQALCWIGSCLADALQYAHERGLVHMDLKPSNILLTADAQPMLLDFHLAHAPIRPDGPQPAGIGGTPAYMPPEQRVVLAAICARKPPPVGLDGRADLFSLGAVLYQALGGSVPVGPQSPPLSAINPQVSCGLSDIIRKCVAPDPRDRYPDAAALAADLHRHRTHQPLAGVPNRSLRERWQKWRQRRPFDLAFVLILVTVLGAAGAAGVGLVNHWGQMTGQASRQLEAGQEALRKGDHGEAVRAFRAGLELAESVPAPARRRLTRELEDHLRRALAGQAEAAREQLAGELHRAVDQLRFVYAAPVHSDRDLRKLEARCRALWEQRGRVRERTGGADAPQVRADLLDLAILWADLHTRLSADGPAARRTALQVLAEAEELFGPSHALYRERSVHAAALGQADAAAAAAQRARELPPKTAWEHYAAGLALLRRHAPLTPPAEDAGLPALGQPLAELWACAEAAAAFERALALQPQALWPNLYHALCAYRLGRYDDAVSALSVCIGAVPEHAGFFYNRALAYAALGRPDHALADYDHAARLDPTRPIPRAAVLYNLAVAHWERGDRAAALTSLELALKDQPDHRPARALLHYLRRHP
jgi:serine/threonine protein kinase